MQCRSCPSGCRPLLGLTVVYTAGGAVVFSLRQSIPVQTRLQPKELYACPIFPNTLDEMQLNALE